jgi:hypothetical protein
MTAQHLVAGFLCVLGAITFTGILCWTLAREDEAFEESLRAAQQTSPPRPKAASEPVLSRQTEATQARA